MIIQTMEIDHTQWAAWNLKKKTAFNLKILENYQRTSMHIFIMLLNQIHTLMFQLKM